MYDDRKNGKIFQPREVVYHAIYPLQPTDTFDDDLRGITAEGTLSFEPSFALVGFTQGLLCRQNRLDC